MAEYPPYLSSLPDQPEDAQRVKSTLRWLADRIAALQEGASTATSTAALTAQIGALAARLGAQERAFALTQSQTLVTLPHGHWQKTADTAGVGDYDWDTEIFASSGYFTRQSANTQIRLNIPGRYLVMAAPTGREAGAAVVFQGYLTATVKVRVGSSALVAGSTGIFTAPLIYIVEAVAGDYVKVELQSGSLRNGAIAIASSHLTIMRIG